MAERVHRRILAARMSVSFAVAGVLAGWATSEGLPGAMAQQLKSAAAPDSITSRQVQNHSLLYKDFKRGEVYSQAMTNKLLYKELTVTDAHATYLQKVDAAKAYLKKADAARTYLKKADAANTYLQKADAANTYLQKADAANTYLAKADAQREFIGGNGSMFAGAKHDDGGAVQVLAIPGLVTLMGNHDPAAGTDSITLTNTSGSPLDYATVGGTGGIIAVDKSIDVPLSSRFASQTVQIFSLNAGTVATLNFSAVAITGGGTDFAAQAFTGGV